MDLSRTASDFFAMEDEADIPRNCLTHVGHESHEITDKFAHYMGCIEIWERAEFLKESHEVWQHEYHVALKRNYQKRLGKPLRIPHAASEEDRDAAHEEVRAKMQSLAGSIHGQYNRTKLVRDAIEKSETSPSAQGLPTFPRDEQEEAELSEIERMEIEDQVSNLTKPRDNNRFVECVISSRKRWQESESYIDGIKLVREFRSQKGKSTDPPDKPEGRRIMDDIHTSEVKKKLSEKKRLKNRRAKEFEVEKDLNGYLIQFSRDSTASDYTLANASSGKVKGRSPDQRISLKKMMKGDLLSSKKDCGEDRIKYFHIPCNNMDYAETAILNYFCEERPPLKINTKDPLQKTKTAMVLRPEYWRAQQHGDSTSVIHARHMRPLCEIVSSNPDTSLELGRVPDNMVLFMPYLHWETDRNRNRMAKIIDEETQKHEEQVRLGRALRRKRREKYREHLRWAEQDRVMHQKEKLLNLWTGNQSDPKEGPRVLTPGLYDFLEVGHLVMQGNQAQKDATGKAGDKTRRKAPSKIQMEGNGRLRPVHPLAQYLIDAARLFEAMSMFRDRKLMERYLHHKSPLHPRRTLDQSYYWTLKTTKVRDRDQVVYRSTTMDNRFAHHFREKEHAAGHASSHNRRKWHLHDALGRHGRESAQDLENLAEPQQKPNTESSSTWQPKDWEWTEHFDRDDKHGCEQCRDDIRKVSRVVMADQLWMWILDGKTIITCFPRRYGVNKQDMSGVHKSIRMRVGAARKGSIRSVFDLALIILDECSNTFFDRTKTKDREPQVIGLFSEAIGRVTHKQTILFDRLWHWTNSASKIYRSKSRHAEAAQRGSTDFHAPLLDISHEGRLQREIRDIIDELDMMLHISRRQHEVMKCFVKQSEDILDYEGEFCDELPRVDWDFVEGSAPIQTRRPAGAAGVPEDLEKRSRRDDFKRFRLGAHDLLSEMQERIAELEGLRASAETTAKSVTELLGLKQQQASVVQAWQSVKQGEEAVRQGRSIMMFTLVTIIFLPLSFMSSVFGMNNLIFTPEDGSKMMELMDQLKWMLITAFVVIYVAMVIAWGGFNRLIRALIWSAWTYSITWLGVKSRVFSLWLKVSEILNARDLVSATESKVQRLKDDVRRERRERTRMDKQEKFSLRIAKRKAEEAYAWFGAQKPKNLNSASAANGLRPTVAFAFGGHVLAGKPNGVSVELQRVPPQSGTDQQQPRSSVGERVVGFQEGRSARRGPVGGPDGDGASTYHPPRPPSPHQRHSTAAQSSSMTLFPSSTSSA